MLKFSFLTPLVRETYKDLQNQLTQKSERLKHQKGLLNKDSEGLKISLEELSKVHERSLQIVKDQFAQIQAILEYKHQEIEGSLTYLLNRRQETINQEMREIQDLDSWIENILDLVSFTNSYQNTAFIQGKIPETRIFFTQKLNRLKVLIQSYRHSSTKK